MSERTQRNGRVAVVRSGGEYALVARDTVPSGSCLFELEGELIDFPTQHSVQIGRKVHLDVPASYSAEEVMDRFYWRFVNHSCDPNALLRGTSLFALKPIKPWQEITFHYNSTEYKLAEPFHCRCGSEHCAGLIRGFRFLPGTERQRLRPWLADHLRSLLTEDALASPVSAGDQHVVDL